MDGPSTRDQTYFYTVTGEYSGGDNKAAQEASHQGETKVDEIVGKVIKRRKSYNIAFQIRVIISHKEIN